MGLLVWRDGPADERTAMSEGEDTVVWAEARFHENAMRRYLLNRVWLDRLLNGFELSPEENAMAARASYTQQRFANCGFDISGAVRVNDSDDCG